VGFAEVAGEGGREGGSEGEREGERGWRGQAGTSLYTHRLLFEFEGKRGRGGHNVPGHCMSFLSSSV